jgi:hypothetical protein
MTATLIFVAMTFGLIAPKLLIEHFFPRTTERHTMTPQRSGIEAQRK